LYDGSFLAKYQTKLLTGAALWRQNIKMMRHVLLMPFSPTMLLERQPTEPIYFEDRSAQADLKDYSSVNQVLVHVSRDWGPNNTHIRQASYSRIW
jgi:hypothetical protein